MGPKGIIFPEGSTKLWTWKYAKVVEIPEEERANYNNYDKRLDVENAKTYGKYEFFKACQDMGIIKDLKEKIKNVASKIEQGLPSIPVSLKEELDTNIFLRCENEKIKSKLQMHNASKLEVFTKLRNLKDQF